MKKLIALLIAFYCLMTIKAQQDSPSNNGAGGYISSGNFGGTGNAAYFPAGIWSNSANNWIYGNIHFQYGFLMDVAGRWRIEPSGHSFFNGGNLGIGTSAPLYKLDIDNAKYGTGQIRWRANGGGTSTYGFTYADQSGIGITNADPYSELLYLNIYDHSASIYTSGQHRFIINSIGNVGIGTSSPTNKLTVDGCIRMKSSQDADGTALLGSLSSGNHFFALNSNTDGSFYMYDCTGGVWHKSITSMNGNIGIGTTTPGAYKLNVAGTIRANEIVVNTSGADFVFESTYKLRTLSELEAFIKANKHLPDIAPAKEMQENGVNTGEMHAKLLQKVEELTLYVIEKDKEIANLRAETGNLLAENKKELEEQTKLSKEQQKLLLELKKEIEILKEKIAL